VGCSSHLPGYQSRQPRPGGRAAASDNILSGAAVTRSTTADITTACIAATAVASACIAAAGSIAATPVASARVAATGNIAATAVAAASNLAVTGNVAATGIADTITLVPLEARGAHSPASGELSAVFD
jgi:hypothetical protein